MSPDLADSLEIVCRTDAGRARSHNEDSVTADPGLGLAILADGMGGYNAGEVASGMATTLLLSELAQAFAEQGPDARDENGRLHAHAVIEKEVKRANGAIYQAAQSQPQYAGMGTTLVMTLFHDNQLTVAHIGDSRLYRWRDETLVQLTRDHSLLQEQIDSGIITAEQARHSRNRNLVTRALGIDPEVIADVSDHPVRPGDLYLLCSDGLNDMVEDEEIALSLSTLSANLELCATQLVDMANDNGGRDNISVILVRVRQAYPIARSWWARLLAWLR
jgi:protein phosphatase